MKRTHSTNIGGMIFHVELDAFERLRVYLEGVEAHFDCYADAAEIVSDIESRIAEQLRERTGPSQVVKVVDVDYVIGTMGNIEDFSETPPPIPRDPVHSRRLYRDLDNGIIAGVAAGIAAYLRLPLSIVRIAFLALAIASGVGIALYLLLWALVPLASRESDKLRMQGSPVTLAAIDRGVRRRLQDNPTTSLGAFKNLVLGCGSLIRLAITALARVLKWCAGVLIPGAAVVTLLLLTIVLVMSLINPEAEPFPPVFAEALSAFGGWQQTLKVVLYLGLAIPFLLIATAAAKLFWGVRNFNARAIGILLATWMLSLLVAAGIWASYFPDLRQTLQERHRRISPCLNGLLDQRYCRNPQ